MTPFRDAMGFVNRDPGEFVLAIDCLEMATERFCETKFRRNIEEASVRMSATQIIQDLGPFSSTRMRIYSCYRDICSTKSIDLVVHEGHKWRNNNSDAMIHDGWQLEAKAFSEGGGCLDENIIAFESSGDNLALMRSAHH